MNHSWQFEKMQMYFDCDTNAICRYSEQINRLPEEKRKAVYADIAGELKAYVESLIQYPAELNRIVGETVNEICRSMYLLGGYGWKEGQYLKNTAAVIFRTLAEHRVFVHFGISGECCYHFYSGRNMIGKATSVLSLSSLVRIESSSVSWYSTFHVDTNVFPGTSRKVMDDGQRGDEMGRLHHVGME